MNPADPAITFEASGHIYRVNGIAVRSVTKILADAGISDFSGVRPEVLRYAQERGTKVHRAAEFSDQNDLDESTLDPKIGGYVEGWRKFRRDSGFVPRLIESIVYCPKFVYIGCLDREGLMPKFGPTVLDLKTGEECESWPIQIAAYVRAAVGERYCMGHRRAAVQLRKNGTYNLLMYPQRDFARDWDRFRRALQETRQQAA